MKRLIMLLSLSFVVPVTAGTFNVDGNYVVEEVCFSPDGHCSTLVLDYLNGIEHSADIAVYSITHPVIAQAIINAHNRGIKVRVIMDNVQAKVKGSAVEQLRAAGIPIKVMRGTKGGLMHDKFAVLDGTLFFTGSFNWTTNAENKNNENLLLLSEPDLIKKYQDEFDRMWNHK